MKRKALFRGKMVGTREWVYGTTAYYEDVESSPTYIVKTGTDDGKNYFPFYEVIPESIGQYTGLTDKNGTKIFEDDIIKVRQLDSPNFEKAKICYGEYKEDDTYYLGFYAELNNGMQLSLVGGKSVVSNLESFFEVIGNIHDNPELFN